jgi:Sec-independent protein secretion pathway component TatC
MISPLQKAKVRYAVYIVEIRKRCICVALCSLFTFICAYINSTCLIYSITSSLQRIDGVKVKEKGMQDALFQNRRFFYQKLGKNEEETNVKKGLFCELANGSQIQRNLLVFFSRKCSMEVTSMQEYGDAKKGTFYTTFQGIGELLRTNSIYYVHKLVKQMYGFLYCCKHALFETDTEKKEGSHNFQEVDNSGSGISCEEAVLSSSCKGELCKPHTFDPKTFCNDSGDDIDKPSLYGNLDNFEGLHFFNENCCVQGEPFKGEKVSLIFTDVHEAFSVTLSVCFFWCFLTCLPFYLYHLFCFLSPASLLSFHNAILRKLCVYLLVGYVLWWLIHVYLLSKILTFFYSFQIERGVLSISAQTKVYAYLSWYISVFIFSVIVLSAILVFYNQKRALITNKIHCFPSLSLPLQQCKGRHPSNGSQTADTTSNTATDSTSNTSNSTPIKNKNKNKKEKCVEDTCCMKNKNTLFKLKQASSITCFDRKFRGKMWWGCLLVAAFLSPPEIGSQFMCTLSFILLVEFTLWCAYFSSSRNSSLFDTEREDRDRRF